MMSLYVIQTWLKESEGLLRDYDDQIGQAYDNAVRLLGNINPKHMNSDFINDLVMMTGEDGLKQYLGILASAAYRVSPETGFIFDGHGLTTPSIGVGMRLPKGKNLVITADTELTGEECEGTIVNYGRTHKLGQFSRGTIVDFSGSYDSELCIRTCDPVGMIVHAAREQPVATIRISDSTVISQGDLANIPRLGEYMKGLKSDIGPESSPKAVLERLGKMDIWGDVRDILSEAHLYEHDLDEFREMNQKPVCRSPDPEDL